METATHMDMDKLEFSIQTSFLLSLMSIAERPPKRPREEQEHRPESPILRSPDYWFEDGSIVLQAQSTQFRVAKTMLAIHSAIFRDMLALPNPLNEPRVEGCPVVVLPDDRAADWKYLLDAMYSKVWLWDPEDEYPTLSQLAGVLRLSRKYDMPTFTQRAVSRLKTAFPSTLSKFDELTKTNGRIQFPGNLTHFQFRVEIVNLAREMGLFSVLPSAFYELAIASSEEGVGLLSDDLFKLHPADQVTCLRGRVRLVASLRDGPGKWMDPRNKLVPCASCTTSAGCSDAIETHPYSKLVLQAAEPALLLDGYPRKIKLCRACEITTKGIHKSAREKIWERLPSYFELPPWEELLRMDLE
ncbi:BTB domain-containing protein [Mycena kentingensis (nom. inval.)]|nr:BTB domain-containing protein [Mycena kentingensis (nom. inval.)]